jgi:aspartate/methionine/tyrosine aminotransferase
LVDETYREMNFAGPTPLSATLSARCISVASVSKSFGMPGVRIGWIVTRNRDLQRIFLAAKEQIFICNSVVDEELAFKALSQKAALLPPILERNRCAFQTVRRWMAGRADLEWVEPSGGVVCFPRMIERRETRVDAFYRILNGKYGTFVGPGHWFEMDRRFMRIGYAWPSTSELAEGLLNIGLALGEASA